MYTLGDERSVHEESSQIYADVFDIISFAYYKLQDNFNLSNHCSLNLRQC